MVELEKINDELRNKQLQEDKMIYTLKEKDKEVSQ